MYYTYILSDKLNSLYIGYTADLTRRYKQHKQEDRSCHLVYYEAYAYEKAARNREKKLKYYGSAWRALKKRITA